MHVRAVRFTDVDPERVESLISRINESDGPPEGIPIKKLRMLVDADQKTAIVLQFFDSAEDMAAGEKVFEAMDSGETPGTRASVDRTEVKLDMSA